MHLISLYLSPNAAGWWATNLLRLGVVFAVTVAFAGVGRAIRGVTRSGAVAGGLICFVLFASVGPGAFAVLFSLFVLTWIATQLGRPRKQRLGTAERGEGRTAKQVVANLGVAALCGLVFALRGQTFWSLAMAAALAEAAADTVSSECGQAFSDRARLITTFASVPAGTDGGISLLGTVFGFAAATTISSVSAWMNLIPKRWLWISTLAGVLGMLVDSLLGAWFERRGWLSNDAVNLAGTVMAAALAAALLPLLR
jgi:uncharacterized protein (TIGR00297 family)